MTDEQSQIVADGGPLDKDGLTLIERRFLDCYFANGFKAREAAIEAGYAKTSALQKAVDVLSSPAARHFISKWLVASGVSREKVLHELARMAFDMDMRNFEGVVNGTVTLDALWRSGVDTRAVKSMKPGRYGYAIEIHDRKAALTDLAKVLNLFDDGVHIQVNASAEQILSEIAELQKYVESGEKPPPRLIESRPVPPQD